MYRHVGRQVDQLVEEEMRPVGLQVIYVLRRAF
jgi:hypothetical protein